MRALTGSFRFVAMAIAGLEAARGGFAADVKAAALAPAEVQQVQAPRSNRFGSRDLHKPRRFKRNHRAALARRRGRR